MRRPSFVAAGFLVGVALFGGVGSNPAFAEDRFEFETSFYLRDSRPAFIPNISAELFLAKRWRLDANFRALIVSGDSVHGRVANPSATLRYVGGTKARRWTLGGGLTAPILKSGESFESAVEVTVISLLGLGMDGGRNWWNWSPDAFSILLPASFSARQDGLLYGVDGTAAFLVGLNSGDTALVAQLGGEVGGYSGSLEGGLRLQMGTFLTGSIEDRAQLSVVPFARLRLDPVTVHARLLINLDRPNGVLDDGLSIWAFTAGIGTRI